MRVYQFRHFGILRNLVTLQRLYLHNAAGHRSTGKYKGFCALLQSKIVPICDPHTMYTHARLDSGYGVKMVIDSTGYVLGEHRGELGERGLTYLLQTAKMAQQLGLTLCAHTGDIVELGV